MRLRFNVLPGRTPVGSAALCPPKSNSRTGTVDRTWLLTALRNR